MEELTSTSPTPHQEKERKGLINPPQLNIPLENVVVDELYLLLRVTDVLTKNLIRAAMAHDAEKAQNFSMSWKGL